MPFSSSPGPAVPAGEHCRTRDIFLDFYDPEGEKYGLPTYPFHMAPKGYATRRQLRARNLCPGGKPIRAQIVWKHKGIGKDGRGSTTRRVAYLYAVAEAKPKRMPTPAQREAIGKALAARRTCPSCGIEQEYYIPRSRGECNRCAEPELYADPAGNNLAEGGWGGEPDDSDWDPELLAADAGTAFADLEAS
jgi:hypothetical protein